MSTVYQTTKPSLNKLLLLILCLRYDNQFHVANKLDKLTSKALSMGKRIGDTNHIINIL